VFICERCVRQATRLSAGAPQVPFLVSGGPAGALAGKFGRGARICDECIDLCLEILAEKASP
jgi:hypothetical protein